MGNANSIIMAIFYCALFISTTFSSTDVPREAFFTIQVVDDQTGRGVPLVQLTTVNNLSYYTDNNGLVAFYEPGLMNRELFFYVKSHGYEFPQDGFGYAGKRLFTKPGARSILKIKRLNIAERLYRITGYGTYRDSVLVGEKIPVKEPLLNGQVFGQDTAIATIYKGRIFWFWGDTMKPSYPLGNFAVSGATSELPQSGGLPPSTGINLNYFVDSTGFSKPICPIKADGMKWLEGLMVVSNSAGEEMLLARYAAVKDLGHINEFGLVAFNDKQEVFEKLLAFPIRNGFHKSAHPVLIDIKGEKYFYIFPTLRVKAQLDAIKDLNQYENFTCVKNIKPDGSCELDLSNDGKPRFLWRKAIAPFNPSINEEMVRKKLIKPNENWIMLHDVQTGKPTKTPHLFNGSVCWNNFRQSWIMITQGEPGEIWFAEADSPTGQWTYARKILTHDNYNFYNPVHHPFFDEDNGAIIYFEGTYTAAFSSAKNQTPMFEYNQIMYRLNLADPRLALPIPVYEVKYKNDKKTLYAVGNSLKELNFNDIVINIPFYALPLNQKLPVLEEFGYIISHPFRLLSRSAVKDPKEFKPLFRAIPQAGLKIENLQDNVKEAISALNSISVPLYEYKLSDGSGYMYSTDSGLKGERSAEPICKVWKNPLSSLTIDPDARAAR
jgi:hypothetical protein